LEAYWKDSTNQVIQGNLIVSVLILQLFVSVSVTYHLCGTFLLPLRLD